MISNCFRKIDCKLKLWAEISRTSRIYVCCQRNEEIRFLREAVRKFPIVVAGFLKRIRLSLTRRTWQCDVSLTIIHKMAELYRPPFVFQRSYNCEWELLPVDVSKNSKARRQRWNHKRVEGWSFFRMSTLYRVPRRHPPLFLPIFPLAVSSLSKLLTNRRLFLVRSTLTGTVLHHTISLAEKVKVVIH